MSVTKFLILAVIFLMPCFSFAQDENNISKPEVGIYERSGETIPDDIVLTNENGKQVNVKSLITKPTVFSLVYFRCPGICTPLLNGLLTVVDKADMEPGKDYNLVTISFDPTEDHN